MLVAANNKDRGGWTEELNERREIQRERGRGGDGKERDRGERGERDLQQWSERAASVRVCKKTPGPETVIKCALCVSGLRGQRRPQRVFKHTNPLLPHPILFHAPGAPGFPMCFDNSLQKAGPQPGTNPRQASSGSGPRVPTLPNLQTRRARGVPCSGFPLHALHNTAVFHATRDTRTRTLFVVGWLSRFKLIRLRRINLATLPRYGLLDGYQYILSASGRWSHSLPTFKLMRRLRRGTRDRAEEWV